MQPSKPAAAIWQLAQPAKPARALAGNRLVARAVAGRRTEIARMKATYWGLIRDASLDYRNSSEFWGRGIMPKRPAHMRPRGRYADRR